MSKKCREVEQVTKELKNNANTNGCLWLNPLKSAALQVGYVICKKVILKNRH